MAHGSGGRLYLLDEGVLRVVQLPAASSEGVSAVSVTTVQLSVRERFVALACNRRSSVLYLATDEIVYKVSEAALPGSAATLIAVAGLFGYEGFEIETYLTGVQGLAVTEEGQLLISDLRVVDDGLSSRLTLYTLAPSRTGTEHIAGDKYLTDFGQLYLLPHGGVAVVHRSLMRLIPLNFKPPRAPGTQPIRPLSGAASLAADLTAMRARPSVPPDVVITTAGSRTFPAHRLVLAARCEYFARLFAGGFADSGAGNHELQDADPDAFELLLSYMYGGELRPPPALLRPLAELADRLLLAEASAHLQRQIVESAGPGSVVSDLVWAEQRGLAGVVAGLKDYYLRHAAEVAEEAPDSVQHLMAASPKLHLELHTALAKRCKPCGGVEAGGGVG